MQHREQAQRKERRIDPEPPPVDPRRLAEKEVQTLLRQQHAGRRDQPERQQPVGERHAQKRQKVVVVIGIEIEVLRIADGRQHAAEIRRHGLQHHDANEILPAVRHAEHDHRKRHEGQKRHVVRDQHRREEAEQHEQQPDRAHAPGFFAQRVRQMRKEARLPQPGDDGHQAVEQRERAKVEIGGISGVRRHEKAADQRGERRDQQHRLAPDKGTNCSHDLLHPSVVNERIVAQSTPHSKANS